MAVSYTHLQELLRKCTIGKQGTDLHTPNLNQAIIDQFLRRDLLDSHVQSIIPGYREKLELMLEELSSFPELSLIHIYRHRSFTSIFPIKMQKTVARLFCLW